MPAGDKVAEMASSEAISRDGGRCGGRFHTQSVIQGGLCMDFHTFALLKNIRLTRM
jgi:hypothetical protein